MTPKPLGVWLLLAATVWADPMVAVWCAPTLNYVNGEGCNADETDCVVWPVDHLARNITDAGDIGRNITYLVKFHRTRARIDRRADEAVEAVIARGRGDTVAIVGSWLDGSIPVTRPYVDEHGTTHVDVPCPGDPDWWTATVTRPMLRTAVLARKYPGTVAAFALDAELYTARIEHYTGPCHCGECLAMGHTRVLPYVMQAMRAAKRVCPQLEYWIINADLSPAPFYVDQHLVVDRTISERTYVTGFNSHDTCPPERNGPPVYENVLSHVERWTRGRRCKMTIGINVPQVRLVGYDRNYGGDRARPVPVLRRHLQCTLAHSDGSIPGLDGVMIYFGGRLRAGNELDCTDECCLDWPSSGYDHRSYIREINAGLNQPYTLGRYTGELEGFEWKCNGEPTQLRRMAVEGKHVPGSRKAGCEP